MDKLVKRELASVVQSSNLNFLFGAGISQPFLPVLGNIENKLNKAKPEEKEELYKEYCEKVMLPNKVILEGVNFDDFPSWYWNKTDEKWEKRDKEASRKACEETKLAYRKFLGSITRILLRRKSSILSKQTNIFTTNIDIFLENVLEELQLEYSDGFSGKFIPTFSIANYKKSIFQHSLHYDHTSEIPVFNVVKIHGSLSWKYCDKNPNRITLSHRLDHFDKSLLKLKGEDFNLGYKNLLVVNPEESKHLESVLNVYYSELLRLFLCELEKENAVLFVIGFSMEDAHIREIVLRAAKSNPTLRIYVFCYSKEKMDDVGQKIDCKEAMQKRLDTDQHPNIQIIAPLDDLPENKLDLIRITEAVFQDIDRRNDETENLTDQNEQ